MGNAHDHHHHHHPTVLTDINRAFIVGILMNLAYVILQLTVGLSIGSLAILSDAGHNFADVASLVLSLIAVKMNKVKPNSRYTYGYRKTSVLVALVNSIILLISIGIICFEAFQRLFHPTALPGKTIAWIAVVGIFVNGISAMFFFRNKDKDLNIRSAFLHLFSDAMISAALVVGGLLIYLTHIYWIDPLLSIIVALIILVSTWRLLSDSMRLSLDAVPDNIDVDLIRGKALEIRGVSGIHHLHIWALSTTETALTSHIVLEDQLSAAQEQEVKSRLRDLFQQHHIHHVTLETEREAFACERREC